MTNQVATVVADNIPVQWLRRGAYRRDEDGVLEKRCSHCREYYPADNLYFFASKGYRDGLHSQCKTCWYNGHKK